MGLDDFLEVETSDEGLGPAFNATSCGACHSVPAVGGTGHISEVRAARRGPQGEFVALDPSGETLFHLFSVPSHACQPLIPVEATVFARRVPIPLFGAGLVEAIPDETLLALEDPVDRNRDGVSGRAAIVTDVATGQRRVGRFGWKAQNKSVLLFAGEAYNVEMGISNDLFQTERDETEGCRSVGSPNSVFDTDTTSAVDAMSSIEKFAFFMRFLAPPVPFVDPANAASIGNGAKLFQSVGCVYCHTPSFTTASSKIAALSNQPVNLFSDLLVHDMGVGLADGISQGSANGREFRTAPLWGVGQRIFFLHDGRTSDLVTAIRAHASGFSEANGVVANYLRLTERQKQDLLNFLRSL